MSNTDKSVEEIASQFCTKDHYSVMEGGVGFDGCDQCIRIAQALTTERQACEEWKKKALDSQEEIDDIKELLQRPSLYPETTGVSLIDDVRDLMQELRKEKKKVEEAESELKRVIGLDNDLLRERKEEIHSLTNKLSEAEREIERLKS